MYKIKKKFQGFMWSSKIIVTFVFWLLIISGISIFSSTQNKYKTNIITYYYNIIDRWHINNLEIEINIHNQYKLQKDIILELIEPILNEKHGLINLNSIKNEITKIDMVEFVSIRRILNKKILINILEHQPVAIWQYNKKLNLINKDGQIISDNINGFLHLPLIVGNNANLQINNLLKILDKNQLLKGNLKSAIYINNRRWDIRLKSGTEIKLPQKISNRVFSELNKNFSDALLKSGEINYIDMKVDGKIYVKYTNHK